MLRVRTVFTSPKGGPYLSTFYFLPASDDLAAAIAAVADTSTFWGAADGQMANSVSWATESAVAVVNPATGDVTDIHGTNPATGVGAQTATMLPASTQGLVSWITEDVVGGRLLRGRTFIPGPSETENGVGVPTSAYVTAIDTAADTLATANFLAVWHRPTIAAPSSGSAHLVAQAVTSADWAILSSRRD